MNKYFLVGFALMLLGLNVGLRAGSWFGLGPKKIEIVRVKAKAPKPIVKVVKVQVPSAPVACIEPKPAKKWIKRSMASVQKPKRYKPKPALAAVPPPEIPPATPVVAAPIAPPVVPAAVVPTPTPGPMPASVSAPTTVSQTLQLENQTPVPSLSAPVIKSIQTEE